MIKNGIECGSLNEAIRDDPFGRTHCGNCGKKNYFFDDLGFFYGNIKKNIPYPQNMLPENYVPVCKKCFYLLGFPIGDR